MTAEGPSRPAPADFHAASLDLMAGELVRIFLDPVSNQIAYRHRGLADARGAVIAVLAAIDREMIVAAILQGLRPGGSDNGKA